MSRLFVAIDLPEALKERLSLMCCGLDGARWVPPEQLHLTLRFIGEVDGVQERRICEALSEVRGESFTMQLEGIGFFPPRGQPRVLWAGVMENPVLTQLQKRIESALVASGLEPESRKYHAHVTLARLKDSSRKWIGRFLHTNSLFMSEEFTVREFQLYSSVLGRSGAKHYVEESYGLGA